MGFFSKFGILFGVPYVVLNAFPFQPLLEAIAFFQKHLLDLAGVTTIRTGSSLETATQVFQIVPSCTGFVMVFLVFALLYSTPVKNPFRYLVFFAPALLAFNQVRLFFVLYLGTLFPNFVDFLHFYLWFVDAGLVLFLWYVAFSSDPSDAGANTIQHSKIRTRNTRSNKSSEGKKGS